MTADADAPGRAARRDRSPFELRRFSATPVPGALVVVEIEGRVAAAAGRFGRRPVLVVEPAEDRPRLELAPSRSTLDGDRWQAAYAIPAEAYDAARFALGIRGTLLDLPAPDEPDATDRQTLLAREANALRRHLEAAEADATAARAEATASAGELGAAVSAARDEALAESAERLSELEHEVVEAHRLAASDVADLRAAHDTALAEVAARHEAALRGKDRALEEAVARQDAASAEAAARHEAALMEKDRASADIAARHDVALEEATARYEAALAEKDRALEEAAARHRAALVEAVAARDAPTAELDAAQDAEGAQRDEALDEEQRRRAADAEARALAAEEGIAVLRAELAEERERSQEQIAELERELVTATGRLEALRRAAQAEAQAEGRAAGLWADAPTGDDDPDRTQALAALPDDEIEDTRSFSAQDERDATGERVLPLERAALPRSDGGRGLGAYVAVVALLAFVLVLLVLLGFLG